MTFYNFCTKLDSPDIHRVLPSADSEWGMNKIISVFYGPFQVSKNMFFALEKTTSYVLGPLVASAKLSQIELAIDKIEQNTQLIVFS